MTPEQAKEWGAWLADRPASVQAVGAKVNPFQLYILKKTGQRVRLSSIFEDGFVSVDVLPFLNIDPIGFNVFGVDPNELEPTDDMRTWMERNGL